MSYRIDEATAKRAIFDSITEADRCNNLHRIVLQEVYDVFFSTLAKLGIVIAKPGTKGFHDVEEFYPE